METYIGKTISYPNYVDICNITENTDVENKYRFSLHIPFFNRADSQKGSLVVIMKNPSSASNHYCDMTIHKVCTVAYNNGYNGIIVVNLFPKRSTRATDLQYFYADANYDKLMNDNINEIKALITNRDVVFAWGKDTIHGRKQFPLNYDTAIKNILKTVKETKCRVYFVDTCKCAKTSCSAEKQEQNCSKTRYPLHGLRWSANSKLIKY